MRINTAAIIDVVRKYDFSFIGTATAIFLVGIINLYSATHASSDPQIMGLYKTQIVWFLISMVVAISLSFVRSKNWPRLAYGIYGVAIVLLILVAFLGRIGMGAQRWLVLGPIRFQPSEFMKVALVLFLARWYSKMRPDVALGLKELILPFLFSCAAIIPTMAQPDLGTGILLGLIFISVSFYCRLRWKTILIITLVGMIGGGVMYKYGLKDYQRKRIISFINPSSDAKGSGYNAIQSKIAIGSGQFLGKGFRQSTQASLNYLPENHTDFVFAIFNEEHGLFGTLVLISLYLILFYRFIWLSMAVPNLFDSICVIGLMSIFFWHVFINMAMVTGILPIVGIPLPLMSYGGSSLVTFGICCGLATSMSNSRNLF